MLGNNAGENREKLHKINMPMQMLLHEIMCHWLILGLVLGWLGLTLGPQDFWNTKMLMVMQNGCVAQHEGPKQIGLCSGGIRLLSIQWLN